MVLQPLAGYPGTPPPYEQPLLVARHEVRQPLAEPEMAVKPQTAAHRVDHPFATSPELGPFELQRDEVLRRRDPNGQWISGGTHWQPTTPSEVAGTGAVMLPLYIAQVSGYDIGCVATAAHPPAVAPTISSLVPFVDL